MVRFVSTTILAGTLSLGAGAVPTLAHDLWVGEQNGRYEVLNGHGQETQPYAAATIKNVRAYGVDGKERPATISTDSGRIVIAKGRGIAAITALQNEGFWSLTPDGYKPAPKNMLKEVVESSYNLNFTKTLFVWSDVFTKPLGMPFEIVPLKDPLALKPGDKLPIEVRYEGKPLDGVLVDVGDPDGLREMCDAQGRIEVTIGVRGRQTISAYHSFPYKNAAEADEQALVTNLTFTVK